MSDDTLSNVKRQVEQYLNDTLEARRLSERDRDYYDHKQWTSEEIAKLTKRNQAPIVVNRVKPKVEGLVGLYMLRNSDPKAYPRTKKHEKSAHAVTDALRYVGDSNDFPHIKMQVAEEFFIEGTAGGWVHVKEKGGQPHIVVSHIPWDRLYYDPHSRSKDFSDARFIGMIMWMGEDELAEMFPDAAFETVDTDGDTDETFEDRPRWIDTDKKRRRVALHFYIEAGKWQMCVFSGNTFLTDPQESPYLDDDNLPVCPIELVSANVDRDNNRYGEVRGFISQQDEINHRRSKALHLLSQRQTAAGKGVIKDVSKMKRELAKPDGHIQIEGQLNEFQVLPTGDMAQGQFELYQDAKAELDAVSFNAQLAGERQSGDLSGVAIQKLQSAGTMELNRQFELLKGWEKRIYRQIWSRVKQFWNEEKWVRVTDDQDALRWVGLNTEMTAQEFLEEKINDISVPLHERRKYSAAYTALMTAANPDPQTATPQDMAMAPMAQAKLQEIVGVTNPVSELDVDIILDQSFDTINVQQEQFQMIAQFAQGSQDIDIIELIELSDLRGKDELIEKIEKRRAEAMQAQGGAQQMQAQAMQAKTAETMTKAAVNEQTAQQKAIENQLLIQNPVPVTSVAV